MALLHRFSAVLPRLLAVLAAAAGLLSLSASAQSVASFTPAAGDPGTSVVVNGAGFGGSTTNLTFNKTPAVFQVLSASQILATVPLNAASGPVYINGHSSGTVQFQVAPQITQLDPAGAAPGTVGLHINGFNLTNTTAVTLNGTNLAFSVTTSNRITYTLPADAVSGPLVVTSAAGSAYTNLAVAAGPVITGFSPVGAKIGSAVTVTGINLTNVQSLKFNNTTATRLTNAGTVGSTITTVVPSGATTGPLTITTTAGAFTTVSNFLTGTAPVILSINPTSAPVGFSVTVTGFNFSNAATASVTFSNASAVTVTPTSDTNLTVTVPVNTKTGPLKVKSGVLTGTGTNIFTLITGPVVAEFGSASGTRNSPVTFTGVNFQAGMSLYFNTNLCTSLSVVNSTTVQAQVPLNATTGPITVLNSSGTNTTASIFIVTGIAPGISSFSPTNGHPGDVIVINSYNATSNGICSVTFSNASPVVLASPTNSQFSVIVPAGAVTGPIKISNSSGNSDTGTNLFYVWPAISGFTPANGIIGSSLTVTGANFTGTTNVQIGIAPAAFVVNNSTNLTVTVPTPTNATPGNLRIFTPGGLVGSSNTFMIQPSLTFTNLGSNQIALAWPNWASGINLQSTTNLASPIIWTTVTNGGAVSGSTIVITNTPVDPIIFFRLQQ